MNRKWIIVIIIIVVIILFFVYKYFNKKPAQKSFTAPYIPIPKAPVAPSPDINTVSEKTDNVTETEVINETPTETVVVEEKKVVNSNGIDCNSAQYKRTLAMKAIDYQSAQLAFDEAKRFRLNAKNPNPVLKMNEDNLAKKLKVAQEDYVAYYSQCNK